MRKPYISFVMAARNDNYGGNFLHRVQISVNSLLMLCEKQNLDAELIIVEWNPPPNAPKLAEVLAWPKNLKFAGVRFIEVPNEIHRKLPNSDKMPMFEYVAKNVGLRRSKGEYVLATNSDIIFSAELVSFLALKELSQECFYRIDRYDVEKLVPLDISIEKQLEFCAKYWVRVYTIKGDIKRSYRFLDYQYLRSLGARLINHPIARIHTNASGDFFLMHRDHWHSLRGYPELPTHAHTDSHMCFMAASSGLSQIILSDKKRIYHQGHMRPGDTRHYYFTKQSIMDGWLLAKRAKRMMDLKQPLIMNDEKWGLGEENLPHTSIPLN